MGDCKVKVSSAHRLVNDNNQQVPFTASPNIGGKLPNGKPDYLIIHYTAGGTADGAISWFKNPDAKAAAHLVIDHNGAITQMIPFDTVGWHAGKSSWKGIDGLNGHSVGIEIVNWGLLKGGPGAWRSSVGAMIPDSRVITARHKNFEPTTVHAWEMFDESQITAATAAAMAIVAHYGIPSSNVLGHDDIAPGRKQDPGPAFNMEAFKGKVFGRDDSTGTTMTVQSATGLKLRTGPGLDFSIIADLADGTKVVPMGRDGAWFQVTTLNASGQQDKTGWVHGNWLV